MRYGFTTGSCAAAAAKAAAYMLLTGREKETIVINTPKGIVFRADLLERQRGENFASCAVRKDGGDDPDITTGALICACVAFADGAARICVDGGAGVGRVTKLGLDQPVGNAAINHVPREMIEKEVREICELTDYKGALSVTISVPGGEKLAEQTFNPRLGIVGGISIIGTSGIVEPMSSQALLDTIRVELNQKRAEGQHLIAVSPGNYGLDYMKATYGYDLDRSVKCSNFIGATIDMAVETGFEKMLLTGHIGKLVKVAGGIMNTHSKEGDCRMELMAAAAVRAQTPMAAVEEILDCVTSEEALRILQECGKKEAVMKNLMKKIQCCLNRRAGGNLQIETILYSNEFGELARSAGAADFLRELL
ncbi:cobalt-precorrin-5B (C(1))-methyltransferase CbiD [Hespellia stercorisuis]|uniref:Cobalt-precorrin-5B C(1)-methyltransferase n=1 Tax=Hespellia stercorisuis DSM 15480 TaxID=1121950 RepID=A0A1M6KIY1_9FIRM|nr:cobalt-precorrin-5B (C(1))-methyltransferase CbiD [Hespellia stercorisuis]SHJ58948.1 cobalt-precorrin 5B C1-methyltransferase [Hespellia stercorisuis DSM 15480]